MEEFVVVFICLALNGLFACFEMAFVTVSKSELHKAIARGSKSAKCVLAMRGNPERTLSVIQIGITLVGMISAAVGGAGAEESFSPYFESRFGVSERTAEALAILAVVIPLTILSVVIGELVPKSIALRNPLRVAMLGARWVSAIEVALAPLVTFLEGTTKFILKLLPKSRKTASTEPASVDIDHLPKTTQKYVLNIVGIENRRVGEVMVRWPEVKFVEDGDSIKDVTAQVIASGHTRLPVVKDNKVVGIINTKEFLVLLSTAPETWHEIIRPALITNESEGALKTLRRMQAVRTRLAVIADPKGYPIGIVTLENILEEVIGDLYDEDDDGRMARVLRKHPKLILQRQQS